MSPVKSCAIVLTPNPVSEKGVTGFPAKSVINAESNLGIQVNLFSQREDSAFSALRSAVESLMVRVGVELLRTSPPVSV